MTPPQNPNILARPSRKAAAAVALAACSAVAVFATMPGCSRLGLQRGQSLGHSYRGVPDDDLSRSPDPNRRPPAKAPAVAHGAPANGVSPDALPIEPVWTGRDVPEPRRVNVFGEMDGMRLPVATITGDAGFQQHTFTDEGADSSVATDPAGKWIAFASTRHSERTDVYLQRVDGTSVTQLTSDAADDNYPAFSPDGRQIAFASTRAGSWQIYVMDVDGRNVVQVTTGNMQAIHPSFSPDGSRLAYCALGSRSGQWELWVADLRSGEKRMVGYGLFPSWSPDKRTDRIAYQRARQRGGRWFSLWTIDLIEGEGRRMTEVVASTNAAIVSPAWSPDGARLVFAALVDNSRGALTEPTPAQGTAAGAPRAARAWGQQDVWTVNSDGSNRQRLTDGNGTNLSPFWSSDNRIYFVSDRGGSECVWSVRVDARPGADVAGVGANNLRKPVPGAGANEKGAEVFADPREPAAP